MSIPGNDICLLEVEDFNLYEEEATDHAFARDRHPEKLNSRGGVKMEAEKRIRREIANSNERRRMQSINAGFQALRTLLPRHEGEKLSKAAILQQTAEYIYSLEQEKTRLLSQNCQLKRLLNQHEGGEMPPKKRKAEPPEVTRVADSTEEEAGAGAGAGEEALRAAVERERGVRAALEARLRALEAALRVKQEEAPAPAPLLEAAIKAEPRVEVEVLEYPAASSTSRQNLETIVEAIRHLEGDHLFGDAPLPLPLTKRDAQAQAQLRPGVIVAKHS